MTLPMATSFLISASGVLCGVNDGEVVPLDGVDVRHVFGGGDDDHEKRIAVHGGAHVDDLHLAAALLFDEVVVLDDLVPASHLAVGAQLKAEEFIRGCNGLGDESGGRGRDREENGAPNKRNKENA